MALDTLVELIRSFAIRVSVALALDGTVGADVAELTAAHVGLHAGATHAALRAHRHARLPRACCAPTAPTNPTTRASVARPARALVAFG